MWRLLKGVLGPWWWRPVAVAGLVAAIVGAWEAASRGREMGEWRAVYPCMLAAAGSTAFFYSHLECRRDAFLKCLPQTTLELGMVKLLAPSFLLLLATLTTVVFAAINGSFAPASAAGVGLLAWSGLLFFALAFELFWGELRRRFVKSRWSRIAYYVLPGGIGAVFGAQMSQVAMEEDVSFLERALLLTTFDARTLWLSLVFGLVFALFTVALFVRRESYV